MVQYFRGPYTLNIPKVLSKHQMSTNNRENANDDSAILFYNHNKTRI